MLMASRYKEKEEIKEMVNEMDTVTSRTKDKLLHQRQSDRVALCIELSSDRYA